MKLYLLTFCVVFFKCAGLVAQPANGSANWTNSLGMVFVAVSGTGAKFCIWETRVRDYAVFVREGQWAKAWPPIPFEQTTNDPVVNVSWEEAKEFCIWLTARERGMGLITSNQVYRLPADREWSAAAGLGKESGDTAEKRNRIRRAEWSNDIKPRATMLPLDLNKDLGNYAGKGDSYRFTSPVGSFPANSNGLYDLFGNVWEWCLDYADDGRRHILRGGSWSNPHQPQALRDYTLPDNEIGNVGFRCVLADGPTRL